MCLPVYDTPKAPPACQHDVAAAISLDIVNEVSLIWHIRSAAVNFVDIPGHSKHVKTHVMWMVSITVVTDETRLICVRCQPVAVIVLVAPGPFEHTVEAGGVLFIDVLVLSRGVPRHLACRLCKTAYAQYLHCL